MKGSGFGVLVPAGGSGDGVTDFGEVFLRGLQEFLALAGAGEGQQGVAADNEAFCGGTPAAASPPHAEVIHLTAPTPAGFSGAWRPR